MNRYLSFVASLWVTLFLIASGNVSADSGQLDPGESDALEFLMLYSESKGEVYLSGSGRFENPAFALFAADGIADTDITSAFRHRYQHDIHNADTADQQGYRRDSAQERSQRIGN